MTHEAELDGIARAAELARLDLSATERRELEPQFARILAAFEVLTRYQGGAPAEPGPHDVLCERRDEVRPSLGPDAVLSQAPDARAGFFAVPKTVGVER